ncbi:MAG: hypothetical protein LC105_07180 [Chitinophagales bacterium]|nr:hypothetical protein [Chitinophagales bacterium]
MLIFFFVYSFIKSAFIYNIISKGEIKFIYGVFEGSKIYGISGIPDSKGFMVFPGGDSIPIFINKDGKRVTGNNSDSNNLNDKILFIGDSYTFGDANFYEDSFPYLIAKKKNLNLVNASMVGYGYVQFLLNIEKEIKKNNYKIIAIQLAPYSVERAVNRYLPAIGKIPTPFFCRDNNDSIIIHHPFYETAFFKIMGQKKSEKYLNHQFSMITLLDFYIRIGVPLYFSELKNEIMTYTETSKYKRTLTIEEAEEYFFTSLNNMFKTSSSNIVFYNVKYPPDVFEIKVKRYKKLIKFKAIFINPEKPLWDTAKDEQTYLEMFSHWREWDGEKHLVDKHYNPKANGIVSNYFIEELEQNGILSKFD